MATEQELFQVVLTREEAELLGLRTEARAGSLERRTSRSFLVSAGGGPLLSLRYSRAPDRSGRPPNPRRTTHRSILKTPDVYFLGSHCFVMAHLPL